MSGETGVIIAGKECMRSSLMIIEGVEKFFKTEFHFFLLSESVRDGHPGKICNQFFFFDVGLVARLTCEHYTLRMAHFLAQAHSSLHTTSCGFSNLNLWHCSLCVIENWSRATLWCRTSPGQPPVSELKTATCTFPRTLCDWLSC